MKIIPHIISHFYYSKTVIYRGMICLSVGGLCVLCSSLFWYMLAGRLFPLQGIKYSSFLSMDVVSILFVSCDSFVLFWCFGFEFKHFRFNHCLAEDLTLIRNQIRILTLTLTLILDISLTLILHIIQFLILTLTLFLTLILTIILILTLTLTLILTRILT